MNFSSFHFSLKIRNIAHAVQQAERFQHEVSQHRCPGVNFHNFHNNTSLISFQEIDKNKPGISIKWNHSWEWPSRADYDNSSQSSLPKVIFLMEVESFCSNWSSWKILCN